MNIGLVIIDILKIFVMIALFVIPFVAEFLLFKWDKKKKVSHLRWIPFLGSVMYVLIATLFLMVTDGIFSWTAGRLISLWDTEQFVKRVQSVYADRVQFVLLVNVALEGIFLFCSGFFRVGITQKNILKPEGVDGKFTLMQKIERWVLKKLNTETWFFISRILFYIAISLSVMYALLFALYLIPAIFSFSFLSYEKLHMIFESGYIYPACTLIGLWEAYYFLEGVKRINEECPGFVSGGPSTQKSEEFADLEAIDNKVKEIFGSFYRCDVDITDSALKELSGNQGLFAKLIGKAAAEDDRNALEYNELYLNCIDRISKTDKSVVVNGNFFSPFSRYFLRYLSVVVAQGDNVVVVCTTNEQIDRVYDYISAGLAQISSPYCNNFGETNVDFDDPIWKIVKIYDRDGDFYEASIEEKNILITSMGYLCSNRFEEENGNFIPTIKNVVFVDILSTLKSFNKQLTVFNTRLRHMIDKQAVAAKNSGPEMMYKERYVSRQAKYICFEATRISGIDAVLKNLLAVDFEIADVMTYNENTKVRCYRYEPLEEKGEALENPQFFNSCDNVNAAVNMAVYCLSEGAKKVTLFADDIIPYKNIAETLAANAGQVSVNADVNSITINRVDYEYSKQSVIIVMDSLCNLPATIRKYVSMMEKEPALILIFSKSYLMCDYYLNNISKLWPSYQIEKIPVEAGTMKSISQKILVKANNGGILKEEVFYYASFVPQFEEYVKNNDIDAILKEILALYKVAVENEVDLFKYFEYTASREFDKTGKYIKTDKILLRRKGKIFDIINGKDAAILVTEGGEITLSVPKSRISQKFIAGQNLVHDGNLYYIKSIDFAKGKIYGQLTVSSKNDEIYQYLQAREYRLEIGEEQIEHVLPTKHIVFNCNEAGVRVDDVFVSVFRAPMDVITKRYYDIDSETMALDSLKPDYHDISAEGYDSLAKETYRRYGKMNNPGYSSESIRKVANLTFGENGALVMMVRARGSFGADINKTKALAIVILNEIVHAMFPSVADSVVVCSNLDNADWDEKAVQIMEKQPQLTLLGENKEFEAENEFNILIVEDCSQELGVISALVSDGENILKMLFDDVFKYLDWYVNAEEKSNYLHYGMGAAPSCFDFEALHKLSKVLGSYVKCSPKVEELPPSEEKLRCSFCSRVGIKDKEVLLIEDGRKICKKCAETIIANDEEKLKKHLQSAKMFMESTYGIELGEDFDFCFESAAKIKNMLKRSGKFDEQESIIPVDAYTDETGKVYVENSVPSANLSELIVHELTYIWQRENLVEDVSMELAEGHVALVIVQYLRFLDNVSLADTRNAFYESTAATFGVGYRRMTQELLSHPQFGNNPFRYMASISGKKAETDIITPPKTIPAEDKGEPYVPKEPDRKNTGIIYYYYSSITDRKRYVYDIILSGISQHLETAVVDGCNFEEISEVFYYVRCDHPELFWIRTLSVCGEEVTFIYDADKAETEKLKAQIDKTVNSYLKEVSDDMSAYEVALHFHVKLINALDYDTVFLKQEKDDEEGIDYIRTICGPFLNKAAVCAGYARAFQYLMQKCGIECTMVTGVATNDTGAAESHAWNLVKIDNEYYYIDTTWDDSSDTIQEVKKLQIGFSYFCVTTEEILRTRKFKDMPHMPPICTAQKANYYIHNNLMLEKYEEDKLVEFVRRAVESGKTSVTFKCTTKALFDETVRKLFGDESRCLVLVRAANKINAKVKTSSCTHNRDANMLTITVFFKM